LLISTTDPFACLPPVYTDSLNLEQVPLQVRDQFTQLMRRIDLLEGSSMCEQVHIVCEELHRPDGMRITFDAIASFLGMTRQAIFNHLHHAIHVKPIDRHMPSTRSLRNDLGIDHGTFRTPCSSDIQFSIGFTFVFLRNWPASRHSPSHLPDLTRGKDHRRGPSGSRVSRNR
jgi:hypothetical protein